MSRLTGAVVVAALTAAAAGLYFPGRAPSETPVAAVPKPATKAVAVPAAPEPRPESATEKEARAYRKQALENRERLLHNTAEHFFYKAQQLTEDGTPEMARLLGERVENMRLLLAADPASGHALTEAEIAGLNEHRDRIDRRLGRATRDDRGGR